MRSEIMAVRNKLTHMLVIDGASDELINRSDVWLKLKLPVIILEKSSISDSSDRSIHETQKLLIENEKNRIKKSISEMLQGNTENGGKEERIEEIGKLILQRKVKKLFLSLEDLEFGELDTLTGGVKVHRGQKNTKDDDVLDDLAELALKNDVEVQIVSREFLPKDRKFLVY